MLGLLLLDRGQFFALGWRTCMAASGLVTLAVVSSSLSPTEQGYYFTFESLINLRIVAELGLSQVIVQVASHELARLGWTPAGLLVGDRSARARLTILLRGGLRWYVCVAATLGVLLAAGGTLFFRWGSRTDVAWALPWLALSAVTAAHFLVLPLMALLEGLGQVAQVMRLRLQDALLSYVLLWIALRHGAGLWALPLFYLSSFIIQASWLIIRWRHVLSEIWRGHDRSCDDFWRREVLPFQWRLGVSWLSGYLVFHLAGPVDAGRLGMSLVAAQGVLTIGISVMRAKAPTLGRLIAAQDWPQLGRVWQRALHQTLAITALGSLMVPSLGFALETYLPAFALRVLPSQLLAVLAVATVINGASQATAVYLRAYREEPLMWASVGVAALSVPLNLLAIRLLGPAGTCLAFLVIAIFNYLWTMRVMVQRKASRAALQLVVEGAPAA
jgi:hypothetical protein